jgi:iron complex transport system permease protein
VISLRQSPRRRTADPVIAPTVLPARVLILALGCLVGAVVAAVLTGPAHLPPGQVLGEIASRLPLVRITSHLSDTEAAILWQLRMPRIVLGGLVGAMLAVSGAAYQGVFRNPLADPYLLGAASGAALGATLAIANGGQGSTGPIVPMAAFAGALSGVGMAYLLGRSARAGSNAGTLILAGVAVASFLTAIQTFVQQRDQETFRGVYRWILGGLATSGWREVVLILPYVTASAVALLLHRRLLDVVSVGDEESQSLGIRTSRVRLWVVAAASLGTAAAVSVSGLIGFVGIIVPHTVRLIVGPSYRLVLPLSLVFGAAFLVLADLLARSVIAPAELPIGVVTAFFGAPFFALVLRTWARAS